MVSLQYRFTPKLPEADLLTMDIMMFFRQIFPDFKQGTKEDILLQRRVHISIEQMMVQMVEGTDTFKRWLKEIRLRRLRAKPRKKKRAKRPSRSDDMLHALYANGTSFRFS